MTYLIGADAQTWALDEAHKHSGDDEFGVAVFVQRMRVEDPSGQSATHPVWFVEVTERKDGSLRIHCEAAGVGEPDEEKVRREVGNGITRIRMMDKQGDQPGIGGVTAVPGTTDVWGTIGRAGSDTIPRVTGVAAATGPSRA